jgi:hypothetical protein
LARLRLDYVLRVSGKSLMRKQFHNFPIDEIDAYSQIMQRITSSPGVSKKIILRVLSWIRYAKRLLHVDELREIIWVEDNDKYLNREDINGFSIDDIIRNCESLVTYDKQSYQVKFSHTTVQEFLEKSHFAVELITQTSLAKMCLTYLNFEVLGAPCIDLESLTSRLDQFQFNRYAALFWGIHVREAEESLTVRNAALAFLESANRRNSMLQIEEYLNSPSRSIFFTEGQTVLHVIARNGLAKICKSMLDATINEMENNGYEIFVTTRC